VLVRTLRGLPLPQRDESVELNGALFSADRSGEYRRPPQGPSTSPPPIVLAAMAGTLALLIAALIAIAVATMPDIAPGSLIVLSEEAPVENEARPEALLVRDGATVVIETTPEAALFHRGIFIGTTPIQTSLSEGAYKIELVRGDTFKRDTVTIEGDKPFYRYRVDLEALEDGRGKAPARPAAKRPKLLENFEGLLD